MPRSEASPITDETQRLEAQVKPALQKASELLERTNNLQLNFATPPSISVKGERVGGLSGYMEYEVTIEIDLGETIEASYGRSFTHFARHQILDPQELAKFRNIHNDPRFVHLKNTYQQVLLDETQLQVIPGRIGTIVTQDHYHTYSGTERIKYILQFTLKPAKKKK